MVGVAEIEPMPVVNKKRRYRKVGRSIPFAVIFPHPHTRHNEREFILFACDAYSQWADFSGMLEVVSEGRR
jgi:hypothetical protein